MRENALFHIASNALWKINSRNAPSTSPFIHFEGPAKSGRSGASGPPRTTMFVSTSLKLTRTAGVTKLVIQIHLQLLLLPTTTPFQSVFIVQMWQITKAVITQNKRFKSLRLIIRLRISFKSLLSASQYDHTNKRSDGRQQTTDCSARRA